LVQLSAGLVQRVVVEMAKHFQEKGIRLQVVDEVGRSRHTELCQLTTKQKKQQQILTSIQGSTIPQCDHTPMNTYVNVCTYMYMFVYT